MFSSPEFNVREADNTIDGKMIEKKRDNEENDLCRKDNDEKMEAIAAEISPWTPPQN